MIVMKKPKKGEEVDRSGDSIPPELTKLIVDVSLDKDVIKVASSVELLENLLKELYPDSFGKARKRLKLAMERYKDFVNGTHRSLSEICEQLGWKNKSQGAAAGYQDKLKLLGFLDHTGSFDRKFLLAMWANAVNRIYKDNMLLRHVKGLVHYHNAVDPEITTGGPFMFSNTGELALALERILSKVPKGGAVSLALREGATWGSARIGEYMRILLKKTVEEMDVKLRVITTQYMNEDLLDFFSSLGQVVKDDELATSSIRKMYAAGWVITINKFPGIREPQDTISGTVEPDLYNEQDGFTKRFEELAKVQHSKTMAR